MNFSALFIRRRIATTLLALGLGMAGMVAYTLLPVSPFPNIDIPTIVVNASMPGASPEIMASSVATPLERHLGTIAGVDEMTSRSNVNSTQVVLQFDINRDINGAARDVQAAINAARADLPAALRSNPTYRKFNPADFPIIILAMTSKTLSPGQIYDQASNIIQQKLSQVSGVGDVSLNGASLPAIRIELNPRALFKYGIGLADVRAAISAANANTPKGDIQQGEQTLQVYANDVASAARDYRSLIVAYRNGSAVRLQDVAEVVDGVENVRNLGTFNGQPAVLVNVTKQPGANVIEVVDLIREMMPELQASLPPAIQLGTLMDTTTSIRNSVHDVEMTLIIATVLVILVVFLFLRNFRATLVPTVCVPLTLLGTFGVMYLLGLQPEQFLADGADRLDGVCGRQHHRGAGKRHPSPGKRQDPDAGGVAGRPGSHLHRHLHEHFAGGGVLSGAADRRHGGPHLPRIRHHPDGGHRHLDGDLADPDADDVRLSRFLGRGGQEPADGLVAPQFRLDAGFLPPHPGLVAGKSQDHRDHGVPRHRAEFLSDRHCAQGLLPLDRRRHDAGWSARRPEHLLPGDAEEVHAVHRYHQERSGGRHGGRFCRRRRGQFRQCLCHAQAAA
jgi:hypothetical protein